MHRRHIGEIVASLAGAKSWLEGIHVRTEGTRIPELLNYLAANLLDSASPVYMALATGSADGTAYEAMNDASGYGLIASELSRIPSHVLERRTLSRAISGPLHARDEACENVADGRNTFTELELAANLSAAGLPPVAFDDLQVTFEGILLRFECKRPQSKKTLGQNLDRAYRQLSGKFTKDDDRGIVAIALDRVLNLHKEILHFQDLAHAERYIRHRAIAVVELLSSQRLEWLDTRVVGILCILRLLFTLGPQRQIVSSYTLSLFKIADGRYGQVVDEGRLDRLVAKIRGEFRSDGS
jgi:hypothetical protein